MSHKLTFSQAIEDKRFHSPRNLLATLTGTALGAGLIPGAPGTAGALVCIPLAYWVGESHWIIRLALWIFLTVIGTWAAKIINTLTDTKDNQAIVIDEVVGMGITAWTAGHSIKALVVAFVLFRIFDIIKPPPVRQVDSWSKQRSLWWGAFGVMADDILAGLQGLVVMLIIQRIIVL